MVFKVTGNNKTCLDYHVLYITWKFCAIEQNLEFMEIFLSQIFDKILLFSDKRDGTLAQKKRLEEMTQNGNFPTMRRGIEILCGSKGRLTRDFPGKCCSAVLKQWSHCCMPLAILQYDFNS